MTVTHSSGCPLSVLTVEEPEPSKPLTTQYEITGESSIVLGIIFLFVGAFVALLGRRLFPYIASTAGGLFILDITVYGSVPVK